MIRHGGAEAAEAVPVAQAQQRDDGEVRAGRLAADAEPVGAELLRDVLDQPAPTASQSSGPAGYGSSGASRYSTETTRDAAGEREPLQPVVLQPARAEHEAAAVEVEVDAADVRRV